MVAYSYNANQFKPKYGGAEMWPVGKGFAGMIVGSATEDTAKGGGMLVFDIQMTEGPNPGMVGKDRLNLHHTDAKVVESANRQLSAYCHVVGVHQFDDTAMLHNRPFRFDVGYQKDHQPGGSKEDIGYTQITRLYDMAGNDPGKAPAGGQQAPVAAAPPPAQPPAAVQPSGGWNSNAAAQPAPAAAPAAAGGWAQTAQPAAAPGGWAQK